MSPAGGGRDTVSHVPGQPEVFKSQGSPGLARGSPSLLQTEQALWALPLSKQSRSGSQAQKRSGCLWQPREGFTGDPVIKYTSLSCGPRNPCLEANQFPAPGGMIAVSHPETQIKHHFTDTGHRCFKPRGKGGMINGKAEGRAGGHSGSSWGQ